MAYSTYPQNTKKTLIGAAGMQQQAQPQPMFQPQQQAVQQPVRKPVQFKDPTNRTVADILQRIYGVQI